jgi:hypothetical protein
LPILDTIAGTQQLCATGTITGLNYSVNQSGSYTYTWTLSSGTITAGQNTHAVTVNWASAGTHQIQVIACNAFGCDTSTTQINNIHHLYMDYPAGAYFLQVVDNEGKTTIFTIIKKDY